MIRSGQCGCGSMIRRRCVTQRKSGQTAPPGWISFKNDARRTNSAESDVSFKLARPLSPVSSLSLLHTPSPPLSRAHIRPPCCAQMRPPYCADTPALAHPVPREASAAAVACGKRACPPSPEPSPHKIALSRGGHGTYIRHAYPRRRNRQHTYAKIVTLNPQQHVNQYMLLSNETPQTHDLAVP